MNSTTCVLPWMHLATTSAGSLRVCCNSTPRKNLIYRENGKPYKLKDEDVLEFWYSETLVKMRQEFIDGKKPDICSRCFGEEAIGIKSARLAWNEKWPVDCSENRPKLDIKYIDLRLGNLCNLKCRMCNPYASNQWVEEWPMIAKNTEDLTGLKKMDWIENDLVWDNVAKLAGSIEEIYLTGGEPTLAISQYKLFDKLIAAGVAKDITLKYNTNLTNIPAKMVEYWKQFKCIRINASVDAFGDLNHYIRYPTAWSIVEKNLKVFKQLELENKCILQIHITVQIYNIFYLDKLLDYLLSHGYDNIYLNILDHPAYLNVRTLPRDLKESITATLEKYMEIKKMRGVISYMNSEDWHDEHWEQFCKYTTTLDKNRNQSIFEVAPIFKDII